MNKTENTSSQSSSSTVSVRRAGNPARSTPVLPFYNAARGRWEIPLLDLLGAMGIKPDMARQLAGRQFCPCCGDKVPLPVGEGKLTLCERDFAVFQSLTRFSDGRKLGDKIMALSPKDLERVRKGEKHLLPPKEMVEALNGKTLEQAGTESLYGYCPCCEKPHHRSTADIRTGPDGVNRKIIFCPDCFDVYQRRNRFATAIATLAKGAA